VQLAGAVVIVTGAGSGIGRATTLALHSRGARVVAVDRDAAALGGLARDSAVDAVATVDAVTTVTVDLADPAHADQVVAAALAAHGRVDALVANAGIGYAGAFATMPAHTVSTLLDVNFRAPMLLARSVLPVLIEQHRGGALLFTTSIGGAVPVRGEAAYCASKTALEAFADALREEVRADGITVSTVRPGVVRTAFHASRGEPYTRRFPRLIPPEQVAAAIIGLLETGSARRTVPPWLEVAAVARRRAPWLYRVLSQRFGGT
jgi:short-subunit dehydrogenase